MKSPKSALLIHKSNILPFEHSFGPFAPTNRSQVDYFATRRPFLGFGATWKAQNVTYGKAQCLIPLLQWPMDAYVEGTAHQTAHIPEMYCAQQNRLPDCRLCPPQSMRQDIHIVYLRFNSDLAFSNCAFTSSSSSLAAASSSSFSATASWIRRWSRWIGSSSGSLGCGWLSK